MNAIFKWFSSNIWTLLLALVLSVTVWIVANQQLNPVEASREIDQPIPIEFVGLGADLVISNEPPTAATVLLIAQQNTWPSISAEDVIVRADLEDLAPGEHVVQLDVELNNVQAAVDSIRPRQVRLIIEERIERDMQITVSTQGVVASGYVASDANVEPEASQLTGPQSAVESVEMIQVTANIEELRSDFVEEVTVVPLDVEGLSVEGVILDPDRVVVRIPISQQSGLRDFAVQVPTIGRPQEGYFFTGLTVEPTVITLEGNPGTIENLGSTIETQTIDLSDLVSDLTLQVPLDLPFGVEAAEGQPSTITVDISVTPQQGSLLLEGIPVGVDNLSRGLAANIINDEVEVLVTGPLPLLNELTPEQVKVTIDLSTYEIGTFFVEPEGQVLANSEITIDSILPSTIEVRIGPVRTQ